MCIYRFHLIQSMIVTIKHFSNRITNIMILKQKCNSTCVWDVNVGIKTGAWPL